MELNTDAGLATPGSEDVRKAVTFQERVDVWMDACFGETIKADRLERCDRFLEEALELAQTEASFTAERAYALVDYVFSRPIGEPKQEVGGVMVTLAALCNTFGIRIPNAAEAELARIWTKVEAIRAKQLSKPTGSALPVPAEKAPAGTQREMLRREIINSPETADFMSAVPIEAAHQRERWGAEHDAGKQPEDWFWLIGYLAGKALSAAKTGDSEKALHHTVSTGAALANWHAAISGLSTAMRPGVDPRTLATAERLANRMGGTFKPRDGE